MLKMQQNIETDGINVYNTPVIQGQKFDQSEIICLPGS